MKMLMFLMVELDVSRGDYDPLRSGWSSWGRGRFSRQTSEHMKGQAAGSCLQANIFGNIFQQHFWTTFLDNFLGEILEDIF